MGDIGSSDVLLCSQGHGREGREYAWSHETLPPTLTPASCKPQHQPHRLHDHPLTSAQHAEKEVGGLAPFGDTRRGGAFTPEKTRGTSLSHGPPFSPWGLRKLSGRDGPTHPRVSPETPAGRDPGCFGHTSLSRIQTRSFPHMLSPGDTEGPVAVCSSSVLGVGPRRGGCGRPETSSRGE